jgi:hypothetical protein
MKYMSISERADNANPKLGVKLFVRTSLGKETNLVPYFAPVYCFHLRFLFSSLVLAKPVPL